MEGLRRFRPVALLLGVFERIDMGYRWLAFVGAAVVAALSFSGLRMPELSTFHLAFLGAFALSVAALVVLMALVIAEAWSGPSKVAPPATATVQLPVPPLPDWIKKPVAKSEDDLPETVTPAFLVGLMKDQTTVAGQRAVAPYLGKRMTLSGIVNNVHKSPLGGHSIWADLPGPKTGVGVGINGDLDFAPEWDERVSIMPKGTPFSARGRLTRVDGGLGGVVGLAGCELL